MSKVNLGKLFLNSIPISLVVTAITMALSWILGMLNFKVTSLMATIPLSSGITPTFGGNVIKFIDGLLPWKVNLAGLTLGTIDGFAIIATILTVMAIYIGGVLIAGWLTSVNFPIGKTKTQKLIVVLLIGTILLYLITAGTAGFATLLNWQLIVGLAIYYAVVAFAVVWAEKKFPQLKLAL